jgi:hypothetical protein
MEASYLRKQHNNTNNSLDGQDGLYNDMMYNAAHYTNIMVEFENGNREMAVDVPDSFIAQAKTPPRYPPPNPRNLPTLSTFSPRFNDQNSSTSSKMSKSSSSAGVSNGSVGGGDHPVPAPSTGPRDHLKIEKDGTLVNKQTAPHVPNRPQQNNHNNTPHQQEQIQDVKPSKEQYERIAR